MLGELVVESAHSGVYDPDEFGSKPQVARRHLLGLQRHLIRVLLLSCGYLNGNRKNRQQAAKNTGNADPSATARQRSFTNSTQLSSRRIIQVSGCGKHQREQHCDNQDERRCVSQKYSHGHPLVAGNHMHNRSADTIGNLSRKVLS